MMQRAPCRMRRPRDHHTIDLVHMNHDLLPLLVNLGRRVRPRPLMPPARGATEGLRDGVGALRRSMSGGLCPNHVALLADSDIEAPKADGCYRGAFDAGPPPALAVALKLLGEGGRASGALIASPSPLKGKSRLPKWNAIPGGQLASWLAIQSLENFVVERASPTWCANV